MALYHDDIYFATAHGVGVILFLIIVVMSFPRWHEILHRQVQLRRGTLSLVGCEVNALCVSQWDTKQYYGCLRTLMEDLIMTRSLPVAIVDLISAYAHKTTQTVLVHQQHEPSESGPEIRRILTLPLNSRTHSYYSCDSSCSFYDRVSVFFMVVENRAGARTHHNGQYFIRQLAISPRCNAKYRSAYVSIAPSLWGGAPAIFLGYFCWWHDRLHVVRHEKADDNRLYLVGMEHMALTEWFTGSFDKDVTSSPDRQDGTYRDGRTYPQHRAQMPPQDVESFDAADWMESFRIECVESSTPYRSFVHDNRLFVSSKHTVSVWMGDHPGAQMHATDASTNMWRPLRPFPVEYALYSSLRIDRLDNRFLVQRMCEYGGEQRRRIRFVILDIRRDNLVVLDVAYSADEMVDDINVPRDDMWLEVIYKNSEPIFLYHRLGSKHEPISFLVLTPDRPNRKVVWYPSTFYNRMVDEYQKKSLGHSYLRRCFVKPAHMFVVPE